MMKQDRIQAINGKYRIIKKLDQKRWYQTYLAENIVLPQKPKCIVKKLNLALEDWINIADLNSYCNQQHYWWQMRIIDDRIAKSLAYVKENNQYYFIQEYIEGDTLASLLESQSFIDEAKLIDWLKKILSIVLIVHKQEVVHGNLKPTNLIVDRHNRIFLIDFGIIHNVINHLIGQKNAPELIIETNPYYPQDNNYAYSFKDDFHAMGMIAIQALSGLDSTNFPVESTAKNRLLKEKLEIHPQLKKIIERMIIPEPLREYSSAIEIIEELNQISLSAQNANSEDSLDSVGIQISHSHSVLPRTLQTSIMRVKQNPKYLIAALIGIFALGGIGELLFPFVRPYYHIRQGKQELSTNPQAALERFQTAIKINPKLASAWKHRGDALFQLERYRAAIFAYEKALQTDSDNPQIWQGRGEALYRLERFEAAITAYDKALQLDPQNPIVLNRKGRAQYKLELYADALATQEEALRIKPNFVNAMKDRGVALLGMGRHEDALVALNNAQTFDPLNPELWQTKALVLQYMNQPQEAMRLYQEAVEAYDKTVQEEPNNITAFLDKANVLTKLQQPQQALSAYEQALKINPDSHLAWLGKGNTLFSLRQYPDALTSFDRALKLQPKSYLTWHNRASLLRDGIKDLPEAIASYDRSLEINPNFYHAWRDRGVALSQNQQPNEALKSFKKALDIQPSDHKSWVARGITLSSMNRNDEAIYSFDRAAEIQPQDPFVLMNYATALEKSQRYTEACDNYRQLIEINPGFTPAIQGIKRLNCS